MSYLLPPFGLGIRYNCSEGAFHCILHPIKFILHPEDLAEVALAQDRHLLELRPAADINIADLGPSISITDCRA